MHKLLLRQLRRHRGVDEVPPEWKDFLEAVSDAYFENEKDRLMLERTLEVSSQELLQRNEELAGTLDNLQKTQLQLVHSEKMAGLGQLIAGISHEINTPAGAIVNAIAEVKKDYNDLMRALVDLIATLRREQQLQFLEASMVVMSKSKELSTAETRSIAEAIRAKLHGRGIANLRTVSKNLAAVGFDAENIDKVAELLEGPDGGRVHHILFKLGMSQIHVHDIGIAIGRIVQLVRALKLYSHVDQDSLASTEFKEDLDNTLIILHNRLKRGITVHKEYDEVPKVKCFADQMNQVWTNLINNAIEAMKGSGTIWVRIKRHDAGHVRVEIEDDGPGIPPDVLRRIFEPYFTTKAKGEGTGLGLSISHDIVTKQKGEIRVESRVGKTVFKVIMPLDVEAATVAGPAAATNGDASRIASGEAK